MKRMILVAVIAVMTIGVCAANADTLARDGMVAYSGTDAFTNLIPEERQACVNWLVTGGKMNELCSSAVMKMITEAPDAVTASQRQALLAEASGTVSTPSVKSSSAKSAPVQTEQTTIKKDDNTGTIIAAGLVGLIAGLIIHNNVGGSSRRSNPPAPAPRVHHPSPQRPAPVHHNPQPVRHQQPQRPVNTPRPPRR